MVKCVCVRACAFCPSIQSYSEIMCLETLHCMIYISKILWVLFLLSIDTAFDISMDRMMYLVMGRAICCLFFIWA